MKLLKCPQHSYTLKETCPKCNQPTKEAHYKFIKIREAEKMANNER
jgi:rRNA maturation protein Nop10